MQINYQLILEDFNATHVTIEDKYVIIFGLDGSVTKINSEYLDQKYIIEMSE